jgi:hypothetical protein
MASAWAGHERPSTTLSKDAGVSVLSVLSQDKNRPLLVLPLLTHLLVHPGSSQWPTSCLEKASFYPLSFPMCMIPLSLSLWPAYFYSWFTSSPDHHPFPHWSRKLHLVWPIPVYPAYLSLVAYSSPWWWRHYALLKRQSAAMRLHHSISQKALIFN